MTGEELRAGLNNLTDEQLKLPMVFVKDGRVHSFDAVIETTVEENTLLKEYLDVGAKVLVAR